MLSLSFYTVIIPSGGNLSPLLDIQDNPICGIAIPSTLSGGLIRIHGTFDGGTTWFPLRTMDGSPIQAVINAAVADLAVLDPYEVLSARQIRLQTVNSDGSTANQGSNQTITVITRTVN